MKPILRFFLPLALAALSLAPHRATAQPATVMADPTTGALFRPAASTFISGNSLLTTTGAAAAYQPLDSDLTAIAALTTTSYGRSLLTPSTAEAARQLLLLKTILSPALTIVVEGDSHSDPNGVGPGTNSTATWPYYLRQNFTWAGSATYVNSAASGSLISTMVARYASSVYPSRPASSAVQSILFAWCGWNDINTSVSAATAYAALKAYWATARADGFKIVAFTITPSGTWDATKEQARLDLNALIRSDPSLYDWLIEPGSFAIRTADTTWFQNDTAHMTALFNARLAGEVNRVLVPTSTAQLAEGIAQMAAYLKALFDGTATVASLSTAGTTGNITSTAITTAARGAMQAEGADPSFRWKVSSGGVTDKNEYELKPVANGSLTYLQLRQINDAHSSFPTLAQFWPSGGLRLSNTTFTDPGAYALALDGGILATSTNDSAVDGRVGYYDSASLGPGTPTSLTTAKAKTIVSLPLGAGDWEVWGLWGMSFSGATVSTVFAGISTTDNTLGSPGTYIQEPPQFTAFTGQTYKPLIRLRVSSADSVTVRLIERADFSAGTVSGFGYLYARRPR